MRYDFRLRISIKKSGNFFGFFEFFRISFSEKHAFFVVNSGGDKESNQRKRAKRNNSDCNVLEIISAEQNFFKKQNSVDCRDGEKPEGGF